MELMDVLADVMRGTIIAPAGRHLVVADLSNIEGRVLCWLAGEDWKTRAYADGQDLYKLAYAKSFGVDPSTVSKDDRQIGKVQELALGYEGGVGAFITFAAAYGIDLEAMGAKAWPSIPDEIKAETARGYAWAEKKKATYGLSPTAWQTCDAFKRMWRRAHPAIVAFWADLNAAVVSATLNPGQQYNVRALKIRRDGVWLRVRLPSGRYLCYPNPSVDAEGKITYAGLNQYSRKWSRLGTYGGKLAENITQAVSRDILAATMPAIEAAGFDIVLTVHDEVIAEAALDRTADELAALMSTNPPWAEGLPLAAAGFTATRYRKD